MIRATIITPTVWIVSPRMWIQAARILWLSLSVTKERFLFVLDEDFFFLESEDL